MRLSEAQKILGAKLMNGDVEFKGVSIDTRKIEPGQLFIALPGGHVHGNEFVATAKAAGALGALVTAFQPVDFPQLQVPDTLKALQQLAAYHRQQFELPIVAITGSCGKTTAKNLLASILSGVAPTLANRGTYNNNIGVPWMMMSLDRYHQYAVFELGANHRGEIAELMQMVKPTVSIVTMVAPVHLEGFGHLDDIATAKSEIYENLLEENTVAIINADDEYCDFFTKKAGARKKLYFGFSNKADILATDVEVNKFMQPSFVLHTPQGTVSVQLKLMGVHNVNNALVAAACAYALEIPVEKIQAGLEGCEPEPKRLVMKHLPSGAVIIDDTYNANPSSVSAAIKLLAQFTGKKIFVLGDMLELADRAEELHENVGRLAKQQKLHGFYGYGPLSQSACQQFGAKAQHFDQQEPLIQHLKSAIDADTTILIKGSNSMQMWQIVNALMETATC